MYAGAARQTVVVIGGGASSEHSVSLASARGIADALDRERYDVIELTICTDSSWASTGGGPLADDLADAVRILAHADVVIPALHGPRGEDGTVAGLLELIGVPYVGSSVFAGAVAMDKWATKTLAAAAGIAVAPGMRVTSNRDPVLASAPLPAVVKPNRAGSSHGVTLAPNLQGLRRAVTVALAFDDSVLVEAVVRGREVDVAVLEDPDGALTCAPPLEIVVPGGGLFDTAGKYGGDPDFRVPAALNRATVSALETAACTMFRTLGCRGMARVDFFVTAESDTPTIVLNEVNTFPGFTPHSQVPRMFAAAGVSYSALLDDLIATALAPGRGGRVSRQRNLGVGVTRGHTALHDG